jgi:hypothetical protein
MGHHRNSPIRIRHIIFITVSLAELSGYDHQRLLSIGCVSRHFYSARPEATVKKKEKDTDC